MNEYIKKNINLIVTIFLILGPILDLFTGICLHYFDINLTIGIVFKTMFLFFICFITIFTFKKYKMLIPYSIIFLYFIMYIIGIIIYKKQGLFFEIQNMVKVFYFPIMLISMNSFKDKINISIKTLYIVFMSYIVSIFIPLVLGVGYKTYEITKVGTVGFFNSANEVGGIISILTPIMFILLISRNNIIKKIVSFIVYIIVILMVGTKTPLLTLMITIGISLLCLEINYYKKKDYKKIGISVSIVLVGIICLFLFLPRTNFYKNIQTHLDFLKVEKVTDVFKDSELIDHFIFSQRLTFLKNRNELYINSSTYQRIFGIGYLDDGIEEKLVEMDFFDIFYSHGIVGCIIFLVISSSAFVKCIIKDKSTYTRIMYKLSLFLIVLLSLITGHILTAPSVSIIAVIIIICLSKKNKQLI